MKTEEKSNSFITFGSPRIEQDDIDEVVATLKSGWLSTGPRVDQFEKLFQRYCGAPHAIAVNSCTSGLHLALICAGVQPGDEVITTPLTFAATANVIINCGATPVFVDVDRRTMNIDPGLIEKKITPRTRAIIAVHLTGRPCEMDEIQQIAMQHQLFVIEDAAHALEAQYHGKKIGTISDITVFSFYVTKNLAMGEGGMITTSNCEWAEKMKTLSFHGLSKNAWRRYADNDDPHYQVLLPGFKYNMMDLQAALGLTQLKKIERYWKIRNDIWREYDDAFKDLPVEIPESVAPEIKHARHLYTLLLKSEDLKIDRNVFKQLLFEQKIGTGIHFISLHLHPYYRQRFQFVASDFPNADDISKRTISLPLSAKLDAANVAHIIKTVRKILVTQTKTKYFHIGPEFGSLENSKPFKRSSFRVQGNENLQLVADELSIKNG